MWPLLHKSSSRKRSGLLALYPKKTSNSPQKEVSLDFKLKRFPEESETTTLVLCMNARASKVQSRGVLGELATTWPTLGRRQCWTVIPTSNCAETLKTGCWSEGCRLMCKSSKHTLLLLIIRNSILLNSTKKLMKLTKSRMSIFRTYWQTSTLHPEAIWTKK